jgi:hypothetical protein
MSAVVWPLRSLGGPTGLAAMIAAGVAAYALACTFLDVGGARRLAVGWLTHRMRNG